MDAPAEQLVDGDVQRARLDVKERLLDRAHRGMDDRSASLHPEAVIINLTPHGLDPHRVNASSQVVLGKVLQHAGCARRADAVGGACLAQPRDARICPEFEDDRPDATTLDEVDAGGGQLHQSKFLAEPHGVARHRVEAARRDSITGPAEFLVAVRRVRGRVAGCLNQPCSVGLDAFRP